MEHSSTANFVSNANTTDNAGITKVTGIILQARKAQEASYILAGASLELRNSALTAIADGLEDEVYVIIKANAVDMENAQKSPMLDRLMLNKERIFDIAAAVRKIIELPDVLHVVDEEWQRPNGLKIAKKRVPFGLIGIIYEARPNVTADAAALCIKSGNSVMLRGGSEAINSNKAIVQIMKKALEKVGLPTECIELVEDTSRETATEMMKLNQYIDVLIPRGGAGLISTVVNNATIPVIQTGTGVCHTYIDESADIQMALNILINAKCSRPSVCNACETLLVHKSLEQSFLTQALAALEERGVKIVWGDYDVEFNDLIISVAVVEGLDEAIAHINKYGSKHSECIVTSNDSNAHKFLQLVDAAAVYVNASTRFTDGFEFGFGAEIGISNQKLHARGPMGLRELTTTKYIIVGEGQVR